MHSFIWLLAPSVERTLRAKFYAELERQPYLPLPMVGFQNHGQHTPTACSESTEVSYTLLPSILPSYHPSYGR